MVSSLVTPSETSGPRDDDQGEEVVQPEGNGVSVAITYAQGKWINATYQLNQKFWSRTEDSGPEPKINRPFAPICRSNTKLQGQPRGHG